MNRTFFIIGLLLVIMAVQPCNSQTKISTNSTVQLDSTAYNLKDKQGKKYGLWIEYKESRYLYYENDKQDGVYVAYSRKTGKLQAFGEYSNGIPSGKWYFFDESNHLLFTEEDIKENLKITLSLDNGDKITPKFTSYVKDYYPNGLVKAEGRVIYNGTIEVDYYKTGKWKYYNEMGDLIKTTDE